MPTTRSSPPIGTPALGRETQAVIDNAFVPVRAKLLEVAAFFDRVERHGVAEDFRCVALRDAAKLLVDGHPERAKRILETLSDPTEDADISSTGRAAVGAWQPTVK